MNNQTIFNIILAIAVVVAGYYIYGTTQNTAITPEEGSMIVEMTQETVEQATTTGLSVEEDQGAPGEVLIFTNTPDIPVPNLDRPLILLVSMSEEAESILRGNVNILIDDLKKDSSQADKWLDLGIQRKIAGDYEGASDAWEYAAALQPLSSIPFFNLGDLYHYYLKDFPRAEENFRQSIANDPSFIQAYRSLHEMYALSYTEKADLADDILLEGLQKNENHTDLLILLGKYYKGMGETENAQKYYEMALTEAEKTGDTALADLIRQEIDSL